MKLQGIFPAITTPFNHEGEIWKPKLQHNIERWNKTALAGYVVAGSTGESVLLTSDEKIELWEWAAEYAAPDKILIAGTGAESVRETVELSNRAADIGYKAALVRTPGYYKSSLNNAAAQMLYFRTVADQSKIPVLIYNFPQVTGIDIPAEAVTELSNHSNIVGMKDSSGNIEKVLQIVRDAKKGFQLLVGSAPILASCLAVGASGGILAFANAAPHACVCIWEAHRTREADAALDWQNRIGRASYLVTTKHGIPGLKYAMDLAGYYGGPPRLPLTVPAPQAKQEIEEAFQDLRG